MRSSIKIVCVSNKNWELKINEFAKFRGNNKKKKE
jgi:hypothetical protein